MSSFARTNGEVSRRDATGMDLDGSWARIRLLCIAEGVHELQAGPLVWRVVALCISIGCVRHYIAAAEASSMYLLYSAIKCSKIYPLTSHLWKWRVISTCNLIWKSGRLSLLNSLGRKIAIIHRRLIDPVTAFEKTDITYMRLFPDSRSPIAIAYDVYFKMEMSEVSFSAI